MNTKQPLVSIITPCYNGASYIRPFLDALLAQTYSHVEFFFINDASTDNTEEIFLSYKPKLEEKGWKVVYLKQPKNGGVAKAVNAGLARFTGKYLTWPDADDILYPQNLDRRVEYMETHPDCSILFNRSDCCNEENREEKVPNINQIYAHTHFTVESFLGGLMIGPALCSFVRSADFLKINPSRHIYDKSTGGQNFQLILPLVYTQKLNCIEDTLSCYVVRQASHFHKKSTKVIRNLQYCHILIQTLKSIDMPEQERRSYIRKARKRYFKKELKHISILLFGKEFTTHLKHFIQKGSFK